MSQICAEILCVYVCMGCLIFKFTYHTPATFRCHGTNLDYFLNQDRCQSWDSCSEEMEHPPLPPDQDLGQGLQQQQQAPPGKSSSWLNSRVCFVQMIYREPLSNAWPTLKGLCTLVCNLHTSTQASYLFARWDDFKVWTFVNCQYSMLVTFIFSFWAVRKGCKKH